jgi:DNA-binding transcriptional LysR family regulator
MNRNHLALFDAVARHGNISRASAELRISQPAVSKQIAELERSLGVQLIDRLPRGCRLTEAGTILAEYARRWRGLEDEAGRAIEEFRGIKRGRLAIGASMTIGAYLVPKVLAEFNRRFPGMELSLQIANTSNIQRQLLDCSIELALTEGHMEAEELVTERFSEDELVTIAKAKHPLLAKRGVTIRDVVREPFIMREEGSGTRAVVEHALRKKGLKIKPILSLSSPEAIKSAVACGLGVAIVSRLIVKAEVDSGQIAVVPVRDFSIQRPLHLQRLRNHALSPAADSFLRILEQQKKVWVGA